MRKVIIIALSFVLLFAVACENAPKHVHEFSKELKSDENQHYYVCECGEKKDAEDHSYETVTTPASCAQTGSKATKCKVCGYVKESVEITRIPHTPDETHVTKEPTCATPGEKTTFCSVCKKPCKTETIAPTGNHTWGDWNVDQVNNQQSRTCKVCGQTETTGLEEVTEDVMQKAFEYEELHRAGSPIFNPVEVSAMDQFEFLDGVNTYNVYDIRMIAIQDPEATSSTITFSVKVDENAPAKYEAEMGQEGTPKNIKKDGIDIESNQAEKEKALKIIYEIVSRDESFYYIRSLKGEVEYNGRTYVVNFHETDSSNAKRDLTFTDKNNGLALLSFCMEGKSMQSSCFLNEGGYDNATISRFIVDGVYYSNESVELYLENLRKSQQPIM